VCDTTGVGIKGCLSLCSGPNGVWHFVPVSSCNCVFPCVRGQMVCDTTGVGIKGCLALCFTVFGAKWCVTLQVLVSRGVCHCVLCCTVFGGGAKWCVALCAGVKLQLCLPLCSGPNGV
jgi:hypothetical protein